MDGVEGPQLLRQQDSRLSQYLIVDPNEINSRKDVPPGSQSGFTAGKEEPKNLGSR